MASTEKISTEQDPTPEQGPTSDLLTTFSETARSLFAAGGLKATWQAVVDLAVATVEGCDCAGIWLMGGRPVATPVQSDAVVAVVDALQRDTGEGPALDAIAQGGAVYAADLADDRRWPRFGPGAVDAGIRSVLAVLVANDGTLGALVLYSRYPSAFGVVDRGKTTALSALAGAALVSVGAREDEERRAENLRAALDTRAVIGQAQGILMERERINADQAFDVLRRASQQLNVKLREVAQGLVDTGEAPSAQLPPNDVVKG
ncbi:MAG TPA: GAF and ANTAR domain-containing protein [Acidimicrobiales bacterium]|jgi:hypothetical protein|nr:GAF and ANTAR domain-containing protein [Acidimicrobiales bacterium]